MTAPDDCPMACTHETFHYCGDSGTHCGRHCTCACRLCVDDRAKPVHEMTAGDFEALAEGGR